MSGDRVVLQMPVVAILVGAAASGKTTLRRRILDAGLDPSLVVSLDELRVDGRLASGRPERPLMRFSAWAARVAAQRQRALLDDGHGYVADATHLRRAERRPHVTAAHDAGLRAIGLLLPALPPELLEARNVLRSAELRVPPDVLRRHAHRRSLLDAGALRAEGFDDVYEIGEPERTEVTVNGGAAPTGGDGRFCTLKTPYGRVAAHIHEAPGPVAGAIFVGGVGNDVAGPGGSYVGLAEELRRRGVTCLRVSFERAGDLIRSIEDVLGALAWLIDRGVDRVVLVGWSFGAAVAISAGAASGSVVGVAALAAQGYGADPVRGLSPRRLLLAHGTDDHILPPATSERLFAAAGEPKQLRLYPGAGHDFAGHLDRLARDVLAWAIPLVTQGPGRNVSPRVQKPTWSRP